MGRASLEFSITSVFGWFRLVGADWMRWVCFGGCVCFCTCGLGCGEWGIFVVENKRTVVRSLGGVKIGAVFNCPNKRAVPFCSVLCSTSVRRVLMERRRDTTRTTSKCTETSNHMNIYLTASNPNTAGLMANVTATCVSSSPVMTVAKRIPARLVKGSTFRRTSVVKVAVPVAGRNFRPGGPSLVPSVVGSDFRVTTDKEPKPVIISIPGGVRRTRLAGFSSAVVSAPKCGPAVGNGVERVGGTFRVVGRTGGPVVLTNKKIVVSGTYYRLGGLTRAVGTPIVASLLNGNTVSRASSLTLNVLNVRNEGISGSCVGSSSLLVTVNVEFSSEAANELSDFIPSAGIVRVSVSPTRVNGGMSISLPVMKSTHGMLSSLGSLLGNCRIPDSMAG